MRMQLLGHKLWQCRAANKYNGPRMRRVARYGSVSTFLLTFDKKINNWRDNQLSVNTWHLKLHLYFLVVLLFFFFQQFAKRKVVFLKLDYLCNNGAVRKRKRLGCITSMMCQHKFKNKHSMKTRVVMHR